jgi:hypothetical protein
LATKPLSGTAVDRIAIVSPLARPCNLFCIASIYDPAMQVV